MKRHVIIFTNFSKSVFLLEFFRHKFPETETARFTVELAVSLEWRAVAERSRIVHVHVHVYQTCASDASSGGCQSVGSNPGLAGRAACVLEQDA